MVVAASGAFCGAGASLPLSLRFPTPIVCAAAHFKVKLGTGVSYHEAGRSEKLDLAPHLP